MKEGDGMYFMGSQDLKPAKAWLPDLGFSALIK